MPSVRRLIGALVALEAVTSASAFGQQQPGVQQQRRHSCISSRAAVPTATSRNGARSSFAPLRTGGVISSSSRRRQRNSTVMLAGLGGGLESLAFQAGSLLVLTMVIAIHEAGHFLAARSQGIRVKNFSIGFGPKLLSFKRGRGLQLGGADEESTRDVDENVEYALRLVPVGGFVSFPVNFEEGEEGEIIEDEHPDLLQNRPIVQRAIVISAGIIANIMLTWACLFASVSTSGIPQMSYSPGVVLSAVTDAAGPAARAGLQPRDTLLSINGAALSAGEDSLESAVGMIRTSGGAPIELSLMRRGRAVRQVVQPAQTKPGYYTIGVRLMPNTDRVDHVFPGNPLEAAGMATKETGHLFQLTTGALRKSFTTGDMENLSGPVGVVRQGADLARNDGAPALLQFAAIISVNLAVINALPIPGLDGGQLAFLAVEAVEGKKMQRGVTEAINGVAILMLLLVSLSTVVGDLAPVGAALAQRAGSILPPAQ